MECECSTCRSAPQPLLWYTFNFRHRVYIFYKRRNSAARSPFTIGADSISLLSHINSMQLAWEKEKTRKIAFGGAQGKAIPFAKIHYWRNRDHPSSIPSARLLKFLAVGDETRLVKTEDLRQQANWLILLKNELPYYIATWSWKIIERACHETEKKLICLPAQIRTTAWCVCARVYWKRAARIFYK